jgi:hypothetical protein
MVIWTLSIAMLVYGLLFHGLLRRAMLVLFPTVSMSSVQTWKPRPDEDVIFGISPTDISWHVDVFGVHVPLSVLFTTALTIPALLIANDIFTWRRRRERNGQCVECGFELATRRGRCAGCGVRIGLG